MWRLFFLYAVVMPVWLFKTRRRRYVLLVYSCHSNSNPGRTVTLESNQSHSDYHSYLFFHAPLRQSNHHGARRMSTCRCRKAGWDGFSRLGSLLRERQSICGAPSQLVISLVSCPHTPTLLQSPVECYVALGVIFVCRCSSATSRPFAVEANVVDYF